MDVPDHSAFFSKTFDDAQRNYQIYDKELLGVMLSLEHWRHFLRNAPEFEIWTDHKNLEYFREPQKLNRRQARWFSELADYDFKLHHRPGKLNIIADLLSRKDQPREGVNDNEDLVLLPPTRFSAFDERFNKSKPNTHVNRLSFRDSEEIMAEIKGVLNNAEDSVLKALRNENPEFKRRDDGFITFNDMIYVPPHEKLRMRIIRAHHDEVFAGHRGQHSTSRLIRKGYWWPKMNGQISRYVRACPACARAKPQSRSSATTLQPHDVPPEPWHTIALDLVGPLPLSDGYDTVLTIVDKLTKYTYFIPVSRDISSEGIAQIYAKKIFPDRGIPKKIISDRGPQFASAFMKEFCKQTGITHNLSTAYHPETDGQSEIRNKHLGILLRLWVNERQDDWASWLPFASMVLNNTQSEATGASPFFLNNGRDPNLQFIARSAYVNESAAQFATRMKLAWDTAGRALKAANAKMKEQAAKHHRPSVDYKPGDQVWLDRSKFANLRPSKKLDDLNIGPFPIKEKVGLSSYRLELPTAYSQVHPVIHESRLRPYVEPVAEHQKPPPPPKDLRREDDPGEVHHEVETIVKSRKVRGGHVQYLVKYLDQPREKNEWVKSRDIVKFAPRLIKEFHRANPEADRPSGYIPTITVPSKLPSIEEDVENRGVIPPELDDDDVFAGTFSPIRPSSPLTTGIDDSIPSEHDLIALLRKNGLPYVLPNQGRDLRSL